MTTYCIECNIIKSAISRHLLQRTQSMVNGPDPFTVARLQLSNDITDNFIRQGEEGGLKLRLVCANRYNKAIYLFMDNFMLGHSDDLKCL